MIQEATMELGALIIPTMAVAFFLVPTLLADDTPKPGDSTKTDESVNSTEAPPATADPQPAKKPLLLYPGGSSSQNYAGQGVGERRGHHSMEHPESTPKIELFMGYTYWRAVPESTGNRIVSMHGGSTSLAYNLNDHLGLVADFAGFPVDSLQFTNTGPGFTPSRTVVAESNVFSVLFGPRLSFRNHGRFTPFLQVLGGV